MLLVAVAILAGIIAGISPCVLPVLPVIAVAGAQGADGARLRRSLAIVAGLVVAFSMLVLAGAEIVAVFHLPAGFLRDLGVGLLIAVGVGMLVPAMGTWLERPFARLGARAPNASRGGFVLGLGLGLVFVPCAGPILSTIVVLGAREMVGIETVLVTVAFSIGAALPLLLIALAGSAVASRTGLLRRHAATLRRVGGAVVVVMAVLIYANTFNGLQTRVPGYTSALQRAVEGSASVRHALHGLNGTPTGSLATCAAGVPILQRCGRAPDFARVTAWLNTPHGAPLTIAGLKGRVVLVDFWTYSCINCERSLPHVEAWYSRYHADGLEVVGVHTPEFGFEHVVGNVRAAARSLGVTYPIAVDDDYGTWDAYQNEYWPADYLIDASGQVRYVDYGEGNYAVTETEIRALLRAAHPGLRLPARTDVTNRTPDSITNPESYLGYDRLEYDVNAPEPPTGVTATLAFPARLYFQTFALAGQWTDHAEEATAGRDARLELNYEDHDVYLVMGGAGTLTVTGAGPTHVVRVGGVPRLYTLAHFTHETRGVMTLTFSPGVEAYDFTFG